MQLEVTAVAGPGTAPFAAIELSITLPEASPDWPADGPEPTDVGGRLAVEALAAWWPNAGFTVAGCPLAQLSPGVPPLIDGAVVVVHGQARDADAAAGGTLQTGRAVQTGSSGAAALLAVRSGPGAGALFPLHRGMYTLGRGMCSIAIADPTLSRHHGTLTVGENAMTLAPAAGSTGFTVLHDWAECPTASAVRVRGSVEVRAGDVVRCGMSSLSIVMGTPALPFAPHSFAPHCADGSVAVDNRLAGLLDASALDPMVLPNKGGPSRGRWAMAAAGLLPLAVGVLFAWLTGSWMFLALAGMGAVTVLVPLLGGARQRREFAASVASLAARDALRRHAAFPGADVLLAGTLGNPPAPRNRPAAGFSDGASNAGAGPAPTMIAVRVGTAAQPALLAPSAPDSGFTAPLTGELPVTVALSAGATRICGTAGSLRLLLNFVLMQLDAAGVPVVVLGQVRELPLCARFLPGTVLAASQPAAMAAVRAHCPPAGRDGQWAADRTTAPAPDCVLVSVNEPVGQVEAAFPGLRSLHFSSRAGDGTPATATLQARGGGVVGFVNGLTFVPDGVPAPILERYSRASAGAQLWSRPASRRSLGPCSVPPARLCTTRAVAAQWRSTANGPLAPVPIGQSLSGRECFDFSHDGPHLLVGGTTGSGKSEFLRTLVGSLAAMHSPADLQFVFIDFKGGAGLGALQRLPHTTSLVTDLDGHGMDRTLASLRAEIHKRESALGQAEAADSDAYRAAQADRGHHPGPGRRQDVGTAAGMAHLVVVVDEFRVLVDQFPGALAELMRIAAVGRSLGIHLVMATQRPQGAVNADIRANVTSSVCLRVQTTFDSQDVVGSGVAAGISVDTPGRAFISRAGALPTEFQCATLRLPARAALCRAVAVPTAAILQNPAVSLPAPMPGAEDSSAPGNGGRHAARPAGVGGRDSDVAPVAEVLTAAWELAGMTPAAPQVVAMDLPAILELADPAVFRAATHPARTGDFDGSAVRGPAVRDSAAGTAEAVAIGVVDVPERQSLEPLLWLPVRDSHVACVGPRAESSGAVALLVSRLLAGNHASDPSGHHFLYLLDGDDSLKGHAGNPWVGSHVTPHRLRTAARLLRRLSEVAPPLRDVMVLCVSDWGRWLAAFRSSPWPWAEDLMAGLVRNNSDDTTVVISGERELLTAPFMAAIPNRMFFTRGASPESTLLWPRMPRFAPVPGRAVILGPMNAVASKGPADAAHLAQLGPLPGAAAARPSHGDDRSGENAAGTIPAPPLVVRDLPDKLTAAQSRCCLQVNSTSVPPAQPGRAVIVVGFGGDGCTPVCITVPAGTVVPVAGGPGSGKSAFMSAAQALNAPGEGAPEDGAPILWVDDAATLDVGRQSTLTQALSEGFVAVVAVPNHLPSLSPFPMEWGLRGTEQGIVLSPGRPQDGEIFGVRLDTDGREPPGRAVLLDRGRREWFQFPLPDAADAQEPGEGAG